MSMALEEEVIGSFLNPLNRYFPKYISKKPEAQRGPLQVSKMESFATILRCLRGVCITASGNILASGNISLKLFMAPLETIELLTFRYVLA